ncbi:MAG: hypothetical protein LBQ67_06635 [Treponema sp.]|jgi:hypothetical protein|nr:hypothetical protein [Treponema sp.]
MNKRIADRGRVLPFAALLKAAILFASFSASCKTPEGGGREELLEAAALVSPLRQYRVYNGKGQPVEAVPSREDAPPFAVTYYTSAEARDAREGGTADPPVDAGLYYVRVARPGGGGFAPGEDVPVEYRIDKAEAVILADETQTAYYDGNPKRVLAVCEPPFTLSFSYYPSAEIRDAAVRSLSQGGGGRSPAALRNFTRVERAPADQGVYYVAVFFPGNANYKAAYKNVTFTIAPPAGRH